MKKQDSVKKRLSTNLLITMLLVGLVAGISIAAFRSPLNNGTPQVVSAAVLVPVPGAIVSASGGTIGSGSVISDAQGQYSMTSFLDSGNYTVTASAPGFIDQQVNNVVVTAGTLTPNVNVVMNVSGGISGKVTDAVTGLPVYLAFVTVQSSDGSSSGGAITDTNGNWQIIQNLQTGTYNITVGYFSGVIGYLSAFKSGVSVTAGSMTSNQNFALNRSGVITGTVTDSVSNAVLPGIFVQAIYSNGTFGASATTNSSGQYLLNFNLPTGTYNITESFPAGYLIKTLSGISVTAGQSTTQNIALDPSGIITGKVTNTANGQPISGVSIIAISSTGGFSFATTNSLGNYILNTSLTSGNYIVQAIYGSSNSNNPSVSVVAGQVTPNINFQLTVTSSGIVSGKVTTSAGPLSDALVTAQGTGGSNSNYTDSNGNYVISTGLGTGTYTVNVTATGYVSQQQTGLSVTVNQVTSNINFVLAAAPSGSISGQILSSQTSPFPTPTPTPTPTTTPTPTPTTTPTPTPTSTPTPTPTTPPSTAPTSTPTTSPTAKPTATPTSTKSPTTTPTVPELPSSVVLSLLIALVFVALAMQLLRKGETKKI